MVPTVFAFNSSICFGLFSMQVCTSEELKGYSVILTTSFYDMNQKIKKKVYFQNSVDSNFMFMKLPVMHDYVCFIAPIDYCVELILVDKTFCENCSQIILKWLQPNSFWEMYFFIEESLYAKKQWRSHWGGKGGRVPPLTSKKLPKIGKTQGKIGQNSGKIGEKEEQSGRKGKNWVPPLTSKKLPKIGKTQGKKRNNREEKTKIVKFLSLCPSWQVGLATLLQKKKKIKFWHFWERFCIKSGSTPSRKSM